jgi:hypothetical protein
VCGSFWGVEKFKPVDVAMVTKVAQMGGFLYFGGHFESIANQNSRHMVQHYINVDNF